MRWALLLTVTVLVSGCQHLERFTGGGDDDKTTVVVVQAPMNLEGSWNGTFSSNLMPKGTARLVIQQTGSDFKGYWGDRYYPGCPIYNGVVRGNALSFDFPDHFNGGPGNLCLGEFTISGTVTNGEMNLTIRGSNCEGEHEGTAKFTR